MAVWGVEGSGGTDETRLKPLGLICYGSNYDGMTWRVFSDNKNGFDVYLNKKDFDNVEQIYKKFLRKEKLNRINDSIQTEI